MPAALVSGRVGRGAGQGDANSAAVQRKTVTLTFQKKNKKNGPHVYMYVRSATQLQGICSKIFTCRRGVFVLLLNIALCALAPNPVRILHRMRGDAGESLAAHGLSVRSTNRPAGPIFDVSFGRKHRKSIAGKQARKSPASVDLH